MSATRVLIVEDETMMRRLLARRIATETDLEVVGEAADGKQAVDMALELRPDVIVMDLHLPLRNGIQATERIVAQLPNTRVIILTAMEDLASLGKQAGAFECLAKGCTPEELIASVRRAAREAVGREKAASTDYQSAVSRLSIRAGLTDRERCVVDKVVGTEMTIQQIATALSSDLKEKVTISSVKHALERAMTKLAIEPRTRAALVKRVLDHSQSS